MNIDLFQAGKLKGLLSVCAWCGRVRDDQGDWKEAGADMNGHAGVKFTHGICPDCAGKLLEEMG